MKSFCLSFTLLLLFGFSIFTALSCQDGGGPAGPVHIINSGPGVGSTPSPTLTPTPTQVISGCLTIGNSDPPTSTTLITLPIDGFVANAVTIANGSSGGTTINHINGVQVYAGNSSPSAIAMLEVAVYSQTGTAQSLVGDTTFQILPGQNEFFPVTLSGPVTNTENLVLAAHALSTNIYMAVSNSACLSATGNTTTIPVPVPLVSAFASGSCYEMNLQFCP